MRPGVCRGVLRGGPEKPLNEAMKVKPELPWRLQDVGDARGMAYPPRRAAYIQWNQRMKCVAGDKAKWS